MYLLRDNPGLFTDLYELTMAQVYFDRNMHETGYFEVFIRKRPKDWGYFLMAGLAEVQAAIESFKFTDKDLDYLESTGKFSDEFLAYLQKLEIDVRVRAMPEGTVFFANEPCFELSGPIIHAQILESFILNVLGFSIITATLAARVKTAAGNVPVMDFGLRRAQGPIAATRAARAAKLAGFLATSNVYAGREFDFAVSGTMAHSFVEAFDSEEDAFRAFAESYGPDTVLLVDTYDVKKGIEKAAAFAKRFRDETGTEIKGIRIDSGDLVELSRFAREHFRQQEVGFLKILVSGGLDEYKIHELLAEKAPIDGFGVGTSFTVSHHVPDVDISYKLVRYSDNDVHKKSPGKKTYPGRKTVLRTVRDGFYVKDNVKKICDDPDDLLVTFTAAKDFEVVKKRINSELSRLDDSIKRLTGPADYEVEFEFEV